MRAPMVNFLKLSKWVAAVWYSALLISAIVGLVTIGNIFVHVLDVSLVVLSTVRFYPNTIRFIHRHDFYIYSLKWLDPQYDRVRETLEFLTLGAWGYPYARDGKTTLVLVTHMGRKRINKTFGKDPKMSMTVMKTQEPVAALSVIEQAFKQKCIKTIKADVLSTFAPEYRDKAKALQVVYG